MRNLRLFSVSFRISLVPSRTSGTRPVVEALAVVEALETTAINVLNESLAA